MAEENITELAALLDDGLDGNATSDSEDDEALDCELESFNKPIPSADAATTSFLLRSALAQKQRRLLNYRRVKRHFRKLFYHDNILKFADQLYNVKE